MNKEDNSNYKRFLIKEFENYNLFTTNTFNLESSIDDFIKMIKSKCKMKISKWNKTNPNYPDYLLLAGDKGILAYLVFDTLFIDNETPEYLNLKYVIKYISIAESELDRPIFFIHFLQFGDLIGLSFETNEQIKDRIYNDKNSIDRLKNRYIVDLNVTGDENNLLNIFLNLKKNIIKIY